MVTDGNLGGRTGLGYFLLEVELETELDLTWSPLREHARAGSDPNRVVVGRIVSVAGIGGSVHVAVRTDRTWGKRRHLVVKRSIQATDVGEALHIVRSDRPLNAQLLPN